MLDLSIEDKSCVLDVLRQCWYGMSVRERECLLLSLVGMSQGEIANLLSITQAGVSRHFNSALKQVREKSAEIGVDEPAGNGIGHLRGYNPIVSGDGYFDASEDSRPPMGALVADIYGNPCG